MYKERRKKLLNNIDGDCTIVLFSGNAINSSEDSCYPFEVNRNFYYLTGLENESMVIILNKINGELTESLFILPYDKALAKWIGGRMLMDEACAISEIEDVRDFSEVDNKMANIMNNVRDNENHVFYFDLWHYSPEAPLSPALRYVKRLRESHPSILIKDIYSYIAKLRLLKDEYEVDCLRKAISITKDGVHKMMTSIKPGYNEMVLEGVFNFVLAQNVCNKNSFKTICASGKRATILHYTDNNQICEEDEMFLCDLGATYKNYCADISRTFPVNGTFSERQKELYNIVLTAQNLVEKAAKPGVSLKELNEIVVNYYKEELPKHGLNNDVKDYYWHSVSHHLGLDDHDIDGGHGKVLQKDNVITNEPGLYIEEENIGIRIEDDLLITADGCENLSIEIVKTVDEIEDLSK